MLGWNIDFTVTCRIKRDIVAIFPRPKSEHGAQKIVAAIDGVDNVARSSSDGAALMCRSSFDMLRGGFYCRADIVKAMCLYLVGS